MNMNTFNQSIPKIKEVFKDSNIEEYIKKTLKSVLEYLEIKDSEELIEIIIQKAKEYKSLGQYEKNVHQILDKKRVIQGIPMKLTNRAQLIFNQIREYIQGHQILDLGCGDGKVGELISKQGRHVVLADIYKNGNISNIKLPFVLLNSKKTLPFENEMFDTTLLVTVLHHSDNPSEVLSEAKRVTKTKGTVIIIESVYGLKKYSNNLSSEQQRYVNIFFDHFYNRVIHYSAFKENKVNVPFNFKTPKDWKIFFTKHGLKQKKIIHLGFDQ